MKKVIYSCILGNYDKITNLKNIKATNCDKILITDEKNLQLEGWSILYIGKQKDPAIINRECKINYNKYFSDYDASIYIDGSFQLKNEDLEVLFSLLNSRNFFYVHKHRYRDCLFEEGQYCINNSISNTQMIEEQLHEYSNKISKHWGLSENGVLIRLHTDVCDKIMYQWWEEFLKYPFRDQLSLPFVLNKSGVKYNFIDFPIDNNRYYFLTSHRGNYFGRFKRSIRKILRI